MRIAQIVKYFLLPVALLGLGYSAALRFYPPAAAGVLALLGRGPGCGLAGTIQATRRFWEYPVFLSQAVASARLSAKEAGLQLVETPQGSFWEPVVEGSAVAAQLAEVQTKYDGFPGSPIHAGDIVLDCGANVGVFTRYALSLGAKLVLAIEPAEINIECLRRNLAPQIAAGRVILVEKGVWDKEEMLRLHENRETSAMDSFVKQEDSREGPLLPLTTIDKLAQDLKLERVDFIKMDIEGAEQRALAGGTQTLGRYHPRLEISVNHLPDDPQRVPEILSRIWPAYRPQCLLCSVNPGGGKVEANILYFSSPADDAGN